jgi:HK97 gp10 family phage protein
MPAKVTGLERTKARMRDTPQALARRHVRQGVARAGRLIARAAKVTVRVDTGLLRTSLGVKVKTFRGSGVTVAMVGPRVGIRAVKRVRFKGRFAGQPLVGIPTKYGHLVEKGTSRSRAFPFLRPALASQQQQALGAIAEAAARGLPLAARGA